MLKELREVTARIEKLSQTEHDLIRCIHRLAKSRSTSKTLEKLFQPKTNEVGLIPDR